MSIPPDVLGEEIVNNRPPEVLGVQFNNPGVAPSAFARTGAEPAPLVVTALMMVFLGAVMVVVTRRRQALVQER